MGRQCLIMVSPERREQAWKYLPDPTQLLGHIRKDFVSPPSGPGDPALERAERGFTDGPATVDLGFAAATGADAGCTCRIRPSCRS